MARYKLLLEERNIELTGDEAQAFVVLYRKYYEFELRVIFSWGERKITNEIMDKFFEDIV